jgi:WD40 repeat protein
MAIDTNNVDRLVRFSRLGEGRVYDVAWSPKGDIIAVANAFGIDLFDSHTYEKVRSIDLVAESLAFSPDGESLAVARGKGLRLVETATGRTQSTLATDIGRVWNIQFSPGGKLLAVTGQSDPFLDESNTMLELWELSSEKRLVNLGPFSNDTGIDFSQNGDRLAFGTENGVYLLDSMTGEEIATIEAATNSVYFLPDGKHLAANLNRNGVGIIDIESRRVIKKIQVEDIGGFLISPDGTTLAELSAYNTQEQSPETRVQSIDSGQMLWSTPISTDADRAAFSPDGRWLAMADWNDRVSIWDVNSGNLAHTLDYSSDVTELIFLKSEPTNANEIPRLVSGDSSGRVRIWDINSQSEVTHLDSVEGQVSELSLSPNGQWLVTADEASYNIWEMSNGELIIRLPCPAGQSGESSFLFHPNGWAVIMGCGNLLQVYDTQTWQVISESKGFFPFIMPDGKMIAYYWGEEMQGEPQAIQSPGINFWDIGSHAVVLSIPLDPDEEEYGGIGPFTFSADGRYLAAITEMGDILLWDTGTKELLFRLSGHNARGWYPTIHDMAFHPNNPLLASAGADGTVKLWDVQTGKLLKTLNVTDGVVTSLAFSQDGRWLAAGASDGAIRVWGIGP